MYVQKLSFLWVVPIQPCTTTFIGLLMSNVVFSVMRELLRSRSSPSGSCLKIEKRILIVDTHFKVSQTKHGLFYFIYVLVHRLNIFHLTEKISVLIS